MRLSLKQAITSLGGKMNLVCGAIAMISKSLKSMRLLPLRVKGQGARSCAFFRRWKERRDESLCGAAKTLGHELSNFLCEVSCVSVGLRASTASSAWARQPHMKKWPIAGHFLEVELRVVRALLRCRRYWSLCEHKSKMPPIRFTNRSVHTPNAVVLRFLPL